MKTTILTTIAAAAALMLLQTPSHGTEFWESYGNKFIYNYTSKTGVVPERIMAGNGQRLSNGELTSILTKTFSQTLVTRVGEVTRDKSAYAIACMFNPEPDKCFADGILSATFDEVRIIKAPTFSNKFLKKIRGYYSYTISGDKGGNRFQRMQRSAQKVPSRKKFNPRFSIDLGEEQIVASTPFHSFFGVFVEPKYGTRRGPSMSLIFGNYLLDAETRGLTIKKMQRTGADSDGITLSINSSGDIFISNSFIIK